MAEKPLVLILRPATYTEFASLHNIATLKEYVVPNGDLSAVPDEDCALVEVAVVGHLERVDTTFLERCKNLKAIVRCGMGYERVDTAAAGEAGVVVCNAPDYGIEEVADTALAHTLSLFRQTTFLERGMREGVPLGNDKELASFAKGCRRLCGSTLGLIGLGKIGIAVAQRARGFGLNVAFYDPFTPPGLGRAIGGLKQIDTVEELVGMSDCVSLHCPLTPQNHHLVNDSLLQQFKKTAFLVNTARGGLVDEAALARALKEGRLAGAALDVFENEPLVLEESALRDVPNLILSPHSAWYSPQSFEECFSECRRCVEVALGSSESSKMPYCVNRHQLNLDACRAQWDKN